MFKLFIDRLFTSEKRNTLALLFSLCAICLIVPIADAKEFQQYCNGRYGFCVAYPRHFEADPEPANGDGRQLHDAKGFSMVVSGINNVINDSLESEMQSQSKDFDQITYQAKGADWFVLSGIKGTDILYRKVYLGPEAINHLWLRYPASQKKEYNPMVTKISRSFRSGRLDAPH